MALTDNLVAYWKLDESSGNASDTVGSITLTNTNTVTYTSAKINNGADGGSSNTNKCLKNTTTSPISYTQFSAAYSVSLWVNLYNTSSVHAMFFMLGADGSNNRKQMLIGYDNTSNKFYVSKYTGTGTSVDSWSSSPSTSTWYHIVATYDGSTSAIYVNAGTPVTNSWTYANGTAGIPSCTSILAQSYGGTDYTPADAIVDEVGVWSRALSSTEVSQLYNSGNGLAYPLTVSSGFIPHTMGIV